MARQEGNTDRRGCLHDHASAQPHLHLLDAASPAVPAAPHQTRGDTFDQADMEVTR